MHVGTGLNVLLSHSFQEDSSIKELKLKYFLVISLLNSIKLD